MENKKSLVPPPPLPRNKAPAVPKSEIISLDSLKMAPSAVELEQVILGALMIDLKAINEVLEILKPEFFYKDNHAIIYQAILNVYNNSFGIDLLTVSNELKRMNKLATIGGDYYLIGLTQRVSSSAHIEFHSRIVIQKYVLRKLIQISNETIEKAFHHDPDIFDLIESVENGLDYIQNNAIKPKHTDKDAKAELYDKVKAVEAGETSGIYTGLDDFDDWCGGFQRRELITIAARPGMGKTTAILSICAKASFDKNIPIAFFSLEMAEADLKARLAARGLSIDYDKIRQGKLEPLELHKVMAYYDFVDRSSLKIIDKTNRHQAIIKKIRELVSRNGIKMVVIDYVQLIKLSESTGDRTAELNVITRDLKALTNELNIPIIIVAQLSRGVDNRTSKRPTLSDLKQSGSIEEDSDTVIFLLRMAYYEQEIGKLLPPHIIGKTEFIVAKGRHIGTRNFWTYLDFNNYDFRSQ